MNYELNANDASLVDNRKLSPDLLRAVSRSFFLTLRWLPGSIRHPIGLAYLLARTSDTIADTELVPAHRRIEALQAYNRRIQGESKEPLPFGAFTTAQGTAAEQTLLQRAEEALGWLDALSENDRRRVQAVLEIITGGQRLDLERFGAAGAGEVRALETDLDLEDYIYRVAGCVGEFWTRLCDDHLFHSLWEVESMVCRGVEFGKGLQLVNVLRDLPRDLAAGRCYLPRQTLSRAGLSPDQLQSRASWPRVASLYGDYVDRARRYLAAGWDYTRKIPPGAARVRLACAWPILIGVRTLDRLDGPDVLDPETRIKVSRAELRRLVWRSLLWYPWPSRWARLGPPGQGR